MMRHAGREMSKECAACSVVNRMRYFVVCGRISRDMGRGIAIWGLSRRKGLSFSAISGIQYPACGNRISLLGKTYEICGMRYLIGALPLGVSLKA